MTRSRKPRATAAERSLRRTPWRRCLASGTTAEKARMVRFVIAPAGLVVADVDGRLPGRGYWLCADRDMVNKAAARNLFARAAKASVSVPADLADRVERMLAKRCLDRIGLSRRAGEMVVGYEPVKAWLGGAGQNVREGVLLEAADGAKGGGDAIKARAAELALVDLFSAAELGAAVGRWRTVHAVVFGRSAAPLLAEVSRLAGFRRRQRPPEASARAARPAARA